MPMNGRIFISYIWSEPFGSVKDPSWVDECIRQGKHVTLLFSDLPAMQRVMNVLLIGGRGR